MCASPLSPRHAQPDWMGGGLVSRQMMHAPPSAAISLSAQGECGSAQGRRISQFGSTESSPMAARKWPGSPVPSHRWYGKWPCWSRRGPRVTPERSLHHMASECATMLSDRRRGPGPPARGGRVSFSGSETARQELSGTLSSPTYSLWGEAAFAAGRRCGDRRRGRRRVRRGGEKR
jgi:hypothetical protein